MIWTFSPSNSHLTGKGEVHCKTTLLLSISSSLLPRPITISQKKKRVWDQHLPSSNLKLYLPKNRNRATLSTTSWMSTNSLENLPFRAASLDNGKRRLRLTEGSPKLWSILTLSSFWYKIVHLKCFLCDLCRSIMIMTVSTTFFRILAEWVRWFTLNKKAVLLFSLKHYCLRYRPKMR